MTQEQTLMGTGVLYAVPFDELELGDHLFELSATGGTPKEITWLNGDNETVSVKFGPSDEFQANSDGHFIIIRES